MATMLKYEDKDLKVVGTRPIRPDGVDKVTGRARYGADINLPGQLYGRVLRSPHAHARVLAIRTDKAEALKGVKAVVTRDDFPEMPIEYAAAGELIVNFRDVTRNMMAREKVLYDGHPVAAVAATSDAVARKAVKLIEVDYEVLPHVIDPVEAMADDAPLLHEEQFTEGVDPAPEKPSNLAKVFNFAKGDVEKGFAEADLVIEREFDTKPVHQGYIEPQASLASYTEDGQVEVYTATQGHFVIRAQCAKLLQMDISKIRVIPTELGGGFGGKNNVYLETLAIVLSKKSNRPVKMTMSREDVFRATGPTSGAHTRIKIGCRKDGRITAAEAQLDFQAGAFAGSSVPMASMCTFTRYDLENVKVVGNDITVNRPKVAAYRAPGAPISIFGVESILDEMSRELGIDPIELRLRNAAKEGTQTYYGPTFGPIGYEDTLKKAREHPHLKETLGPDQGRGIATGFWFNIGKETTTTLNVNEDGSVTVILGTIDVAGGSRAAMAMMVAEELGIDVDKVRPQIGDTQALGFNFVTAGSRGTFASGMAVTVAARKAIDTMRERAAQMWDVPVDGVVWEDGHARPASSNVGEFEPLSIVEIAREGGHDRRPDRGARGDHRRRRGARLRDPYRRRRGRPEDRAGQDPALHGDPGYRQGDPPGLCGRPVPGRRGAGNRLGAQRGIHLRRGRNPPEPGLPRLPRAGGLGRAVHRDRDRRGAQPEPPLRGTRHRRSADHPADRGDFERDPRRHRHPAPRTADVAAKGAESDPLRPGTAPPDRAISGRMQSPPSRR